MIGRGIDQILPSPGNPTLFEPYMKNALGYVRIAEERYGPIPSPVSFSYIWGEALKALQDMKPDLRLINLETAITKSDDYWKGKEIHYRMSPGNVASILSAGIDFCSLANNHVLDWGYVGLTETLQILKDVGVKTAGAGKNLREAEIPALLETRCKTRVIVLSCGTETSGIPPRWAASADLPGVNLLRDLSMETVCNLKAVINRVKQPGDIVVVSVHWGGNWGYEITRQQREFAHGLIDDADVDVIHGHSSHHVKGIEVYKEKLILYGCGDFLNDYEGIGGYEHFRSDLGLMYFASVEPITGNLVSLLMPPTQIRHFRVCRASREDASWLRDILNREGGALGTGLELRRDSVLTLRWKRSGATLPYRQRRL